MSRCVHALEERRWPEGFGAGVVEAAGIGGLKAVPCRDGTSVTGT